MTLKLVLVAKNDLILGYVSIVIKQVDSSSTVRGLSAVVPQLSISIGASSVVPASGSVASVGGDFLFAGRRGLQGPLVSADFFLLPIGGALSELSESSLGVGAL